jgi:hypothetical protein
MSKPTHIIRFVANEDNRTHIGQLVDTSRDVGLDSVDGKEIKAYKINGTIFDGEITKQVYTVKQLLSPVSTEDCNYIRCLGLNYKDHAAVGTAPDQPMTCSDRTYRKEVSTCPKRPSSSPSPATPSPTPTQPPLPYLRQHKTAHQTTRQSCVS